MTSSQQLFFKLVKHPLKFRWYLFYKLPAAFFSGIKIKKITEEIGLTTVSYKWLTQNPFHSIYFASLAMAAEMSTGILIMSNIYKRKKHLSMLVIKMEAAYFKKAVGEICFSCEQGNEITAAINSAMETGEAKSLTIQSVGRNREQELVAAFSFTWSFKVRS